MKTLEKIYVGSTTIDFMILELAESIRKSGIEFEQVVGIERGGLHISQRLAQILNLPHDSVRISCYDDMGRRSDPIVEGWYNSDLRTLVVDDLIDGGTTIKLFKERFLYKTTDAVAVLFWREGSIKPEFYVDKKPEPWLVFFWEQEYED